MTGLKPSKWLKARISTLEKEREKLQGEVEQLLMAGETLQRHYGELKGEHENLERRHREKLEIFEDEKNSLKREIECQRKRN